ncbi:MAG: TonB-dependent receptor domain-containing protein [Janthinobacterium lividum]
MPTSLLPQPAARLAYSLLLWLLAATSALAQTTLTGRAIDEANQQGLSFANVVLKAATPDGKLVQAAVADEQGHFTLAGVKAGTYQLQVLQLGFATHTQPVQVAAGLASLDLGTLGLKPAAQNLGEVVVTARKPLLEQKPDRVTMNVDGSLLAAGNSAYDVLAAAPSVQLVEGRPLQFRGKTGVVILLNGKRLPGGTSLETLLASIPGDQIDRIELISNPSARYDADAAGGVIEIYTKRAKELGWSANVGANLRQGQRTGGGFNGGLRVSTPQFDLAASGSFARRGGFERSTGSRQFYGGGTEAIASLAQTSDLDKILQDHSFSGSLNYHPSARTTLGFDVDVQGGSLAGAGWADAVLSQPIGRTTSAVQEDVLLQENFTNYTVFYKHELDSLHSNFLLSSTYATLHNNQQQTFDQQIQGPSDSVGLPSHFRNYIPAVYHISTTAADYTKVYGANTRLEAGLKYTDTRNQSQQQAESLVGGTWTPQALTPFAQLGYQEQVAAGYLNGNHTVGKLNLQAGLRAERTHYRVEHGIDSTYFNLFPNLRADYKVTADYTASLAYAKNINRPAYENLIPYERFLDTYTSQRGNARLRPEYAHSFSWNNLYKGYGVQLSYTQTTGAISQVYLYDAANLRLTATNQNFQQRHLATANFTAPVTVAKWWTMNNSLLLTYQQLSFPNPLDNNSVLTRSKTYVNVSSDNTFTLGKGWSVRAYGFYNSPSIYGLFDWAAYSYASLGVKKTFLAKRASLNLTVADLFYQLNFLETSSIRPVDYASRLRNDTRYVKLAFTFTFGKTDFKSKRVETNTNATERGRLGM